MILAMRVGEAMAGSLRARWMLVVLLMAALAMPLCPSAACCPHCKPSAAQNVAVAECRHCDAALALEAAAAGPVEWAAPKIFSTTRMLAMDGMPDAMVRDALRMSAGRGRVMAAVVLRT